MFQRIERIVLLATTALVLPLPAPALSFDPPESVLDHAVRLSWGDLGSADKVQIQRRLDGGPWEFLGFVAAGDEPVLIDRGPAGLGLPAGEVEYLLRGRYPDGSGGLVSGPWHAETLTLPRQCDPQPAVPDPQSPLPIVPIDDRDGDGLFSGQDVALALDACESVGGCVLEALPVTYDDVEILLGSYQAQPCPDTTTCGNWALPRGLVIQGHGSATVFRSRIYGPGDYTPRPVFRVGLDDGDPLFDGVRFRNFTVDGRKREQPDPGTLSKTWHHDGIDVLSPVAPPRGGCIHNVGAREFFTNGFALNGAEDWIIEHNTISDIGCNTERTPCDGFTAATPPAKPYRPDTQALGFGINVLQFTKGTVVRHNTIVRATKMGIQFKTNTSDWPHPPLPEQQAIIARDFHAHDNYVTEGMGSGIAVNGGIDGLIENNLVEFTTAPDEADVQSGAGFVCGNWTQRLVVANNVFRSNGQEGMNLGCTGEDLVVYGNQTYDNCLDDGAAQGAIRISTSSPGDTAVIAYNTVDAGACEHALLAGTGWDQVVVAGGTYVSGSASSSAFNLSGGASFLIGWLSILSGGGQPVPGIRIGTAVEYALIRSDTLISGFSPSVFDKSGNAIVCDQVGSPACQ